MPTERPNERLARHVVSTALDVPVERYEDGSAPAQVDGVIRYQEGNGWLEIIGDHDSAFASQWSALEKIDHRLVVPGLRRRWSVQLLRRAKVREVANELPDLLLTLQDADADQALDIENKMMAMRVCSAYAIDDDQSGVVLLHAEGWSGTTGHGDTLATWVEGVLREQSDVPAKLAACPEGERHAFLWATIGSDYATQFKLENRDGEQLPQQAPDLPHGVTHVWVAGSMSSQGALAWFPDRGWWRAWEPPRDGSPVQLTT